MKRDRLKHPVTAGSVLGKVLGQMGLGPSISRHNLVRLWPKIVDKAVSRHAKAEKIVASTLHVIVDSSVWMNELAAVKSVLLEKINASIQSDAAKITDIRFHQRSWAKESPANPEVSSDSAQLSEKDIRLVRNLLEPVKDGQLREVLKRVLEKDALFKQPPH